MPDNRWDNLKAGGQRGPPPPFARDEFVPVVGGPHHDGLQHAPVGDGRGQFGHILRRDFAPRLQPAGPNFVDGEIADQSFIEGLPAQKGAQSSTPPAATCSESRVRASNMVSRTPDMSSAGFRYRCTSVTESRSWLRPSSA